MVVMVMYFRDLGVHYTFPRAIPMTWHQSVVSCCLSLGGGVVVVVVVVVVGMVLFCLFGLVFVCFWFDFVCFLAVVAIVVEW